MIEHRLNGVQQKVDGLNPVFLLTLETRIEDLHSDLIELRNLYSSPTSSLNLVLDGLLKKVKDLESKRERSPNKGHRNQQSMGSAMRGSNDDGYRQSRNAAAGG